MPTTISLAQVDAALDAWFKSLAMIGGLKPHQQERYRAAMEAALHAARNVQAKNEAVSAQHSTMADA